MRINWPQFGGVYPIEVKYRDGVPAIDERSVASAVVFNLIRHGSIPRCSGIISCPKPYVDSALEGVEQGEGFELVGTEDKEAYKAQLPDDVQVIDTPWADMAHSLFLFVNDEDGDDYEFAVKGGYEDLDAEWINPRSEVEIVLSAIEKKRIGQEQNPFEILIKSIKGKSADSLSIELQAACPRQLSRHNGPFELVLRSA